MFFCDCCFMIYMICNFWYVLYFSCYFSTTCFQTWIYSERIMSFLLFRCFSDFMKSWGMSPVLKTCGEVWLNLLNKGNLRQKSFFQQEINYLAAVSYKLLWEVPSKLEIQCKKGMYFYLILVGILWTKSAKRDENYFLMVLYCFSLLMSYLSPPLIGLITDLLLLC